MRNTTDTAAPSPSREVSSLDTTQHPPQLHEPDGSPTWLLRGDHFIVAMTLCQAGTPLGRAAGAREHALLLPPGVGARLHHNGQAYSADGDSLTILPPGAVEVTLDAAGLAVRIFSAAESDLLEQTANAALYLDVPPRAPLPWHVPVDGYKVRHYALDRYAHTDGPLIRPRLFRTEDLMVNVFEPFRHPRPLSEVRPHAHDAFDQASIALTGDWIHHLRTPWGADMTQWRDDQHLPLPSPSVVVIPARLIHTTRNTTPGAWLVDVFGTPRADFLRAGLVLNADEYAMPPAELESAATHVPDAWRRAQAPSSNNPTTTVTSP